MGSAADFLGTCGPASIAGHQQERAQLYLPIVINCVFNFSICITFGSQSNVTRRQVTGTQCQILELKWSLSGWMDVSRASFCQRLDLSDAVFT